MRGTPAEPPVRDFVLAEAEQQAEQVVTRVLAPRYSVVAHSGPRVMRRTWLDTFDWRLHRAGLSLAHVTGRGVGELVLADGGGGRIAVPAGRLRWPAPAGTVPAGALRDRVGPAAGVRALLPAARDTVSMSVLRVRDAEEKTVAWLRVERDSAAQPAAAHLSTRLSVSAVRGYQAQADRIAGRLALVPGVAPASVSSLDAALAAAGRRPGDYTNKLDIPLDAAMPARLALAEILQRLLDTLEANVGGTIRDIDPEFLHDLRVSVRRTRTALKLAAGALPAGVAQKYRAEFKWLGDATTPTRDLDVYLLGYESMAASLTWAVPEDLAPFRDFLGRRRAAEQRRLARALRSARFAGLAGEWRGVLAGLAPADGDPGAARLASGIVRRAYRRTLARGGAITADSAPERLHDMRKQCKELRYALEFFASLQDPALHRPAVRALKDLQDCLGTFQDCQVQQREIKVIATEMMDSRAAPATTLLAMGDLAAQTARRGRAARAEFHSRFSAFASEANQRRMRALTADARP